MERANESFEDANILANAQRWHACINRLYYACFYAISALLLCDGLTSSKHTGIRSLFNKNYVRSGLVSKEIAAIYNDLFERRQEGDYLDFINYNESQVLPWLSKVRKLIDYISMLIKEKAN